MSITTKAEYRNKRHQRIRKNIRGTAERPRMSVRVSNKNIYVQFIDDDSGKTVASVSCSDVEKVNVSAADELGKKAAAAAKDAGIASVVFDRGGHKFHGIVKAVADGLVREGLLNGKAAPLADEKADKKSDDKSGKGKAKDKEE